MNLTTYFEKTVGLGVLATADTDGKIDLALYTTPRVVVADIIAFVMRRKRTHQNLQTNPHGAYMFLEGGNGGEGKRLYLTKICEESEEPADGYFHDQDPPVYPATLDDSDKSVVYFHVDGVRALIGDKGL